LAKDARRFWKTGLPKRRPVSPIPTKPDFDAAAGLYRINGDIDFRFKGSIAPWNWQVTMAGLLKDLPDPALTARSTSIMEGFYDEWSADENGALFRYWPKAAFEDRDGSPSKRAGERYEDTGHAGISLLSAAEFPDLMTGDHVAALKSREDFLLTFGSETPRDLDGSGPIGPRWFPAGGWSSIPSEAFKKRFAGPVPGVQSADTVFAYANLFDPDATSSSRSKFTVAQTAASRTALTLIKAGRPSWRIIRSSNCSRIKARLQPRPESYVFSIK
jgi:hypothetical protein